MKKVIFKSKKFVKPVILGALTILSAVTASVAVKGFTDGKSVSYAESVNIAGMQSEAPENFESQINLNKYDGAKCELVYDEIIVNYPSAYSAATQAIFSGNWCNYKDTDTYFLDSSNLPVVNAVELKKNYYDSTYTLLIENKEDEKTYSSFEMPASKDVVSHVKSRAITVNEYESGSVENYVGFYDAEINYVSETETYKQYNIADAAWNEYSDEQLNELQTLTSSKEVKAKLEEKTRRLDIGQNEHKETWGEDIFDFIPESVLLRPDKSAFIGREYGFLYSSHDLLKRYNYQTNSYVRCIYDENRNVVGYEPYVFDPDRCYLDIDLIIFSIDSELVGRE